MPSIGLCLSRQRREKRCLEQQEQCREQRKIIENRRNIKKLAGAGVYPFDRETLRPAVRCERASTASVASAGTYGSSASRGSASRRSWTRARVMWHMLLWTLWIGSRERPQRKPEKDEAKGANKASNRWEDWTYNLMRFAECSHKSSTTIIVFR